MSPDSLTQVAIAVVESQGRFLVGRRAEHLPLGGLWEFPGGKVEPQETAAAAAVRECREETGLDVEIVNTYPSCRQQYAHGSLCLNFFACRLQTAAIDPVAPFVWLTRAELAECRFPEGNQQLLGRILAPVDSTVPPKAC